MIDWHWLIAFCAAFIVGGVLGVKYARRFWAMFAIDAFGVAIGLALMPVLGSVTVPYWFFWVFGVSTGAGVHRLITRRRIREASVLQPGH